MEVITQKLKILKLFLNPFNNNKNDKLFVKIFVFLIFYRILLNTHYIYLCN